jgi:hypothetical protein
VALRPPVGEGVRAGDRAPAGRLWQNPALFIATAACMDISRSRPVPAARAGSTEGRTHG